MGVPPVRRRDLGVPAWYVDDEPSGPATVGVVVLLGPVDETLSTRGLSTLVAGSIWQAHPEPDRVALDWRPSTVSLWVECDGEAVDEELAALVGALQDPDLGYAEWALDEPDAYLGDLSDLDPTWAHFFGARGVGLLSSEHLGVLRLSLDDVRSCWRRHVHDHGVAVFATRPVRGGVDLDPGRAPTVDPAPLLDVPFPHCTHVDRPAFLAVDTLVTRDPVATVLGRLVAVRLRDRIQRQAALQRGAYAYSARHTNTVVDRTSAIDSFTLECDVPLEVVLQDVLEELGADGCRARDVRMVVETIAGELGDPARLGAVVGDVAVAALADERDQRPDRWIAQLRAVTPSSVEARAPHLLDHARVLVGGDRPDRSPFGPWIEDEGAQLERGRVLRPRESDGVDELLVLDDRAIARVEDESWVTCAIDDLGAVVSWGDSSLTAFALDGSVIDLDARRWPAVERVRAHLAARVDPDRWIDASIPAPWAPPSEPEGGWQ